MPDCVSHIVTKSPSGGLFLCIMNRERLQDIGRQIGESHPEIRMANLDARKAVNARSLMSSIQEILGLPAYFGHNWDALDECMADRSFSPRVATMLLVMEADQLMSKGTSAEKQMLAQILNRVPEGRAASGYANLPDAEYPPFWIVLAFSNDSALGRFRRVATNSVDVEA